MNDPSPSRIVLDVAKWFDGENGNTYHVVIVTLPGHATHRSCFEYGYGEHYLHTAAETLKAAGVYPTARSSYEIRRWAADLGAEIEVYETECETETELREWQVSVRDLRAIAYLALVGENDGDAYRANRDATGSIRRAIAENRRLNAEQLQGDDGKPRDLPPFVIREASRRVERSWHGWEA